MDAGYFATKQPGDQTANYVGQSGARTTTFKFIGMEDLGGGTSANFQLEVQPSLIAGDGNISGLAGITKQGTASTSTTASNASNPSGLVGKGYSYVGLKNTQYGEVQFGTINTATFGAIATASQLGTGIGSGYNTGVISDITRVESAMAYFSPKYNGFSARLLKGTGNDLSYGSAASSINGRPSVVDIGLSYDNGPLALRYGQLRSTAVPSSGVATTTKVLSGAYDMQVAKISLATGSMKTDAANNATDANISLVAVSVPFMGSYRAIAQAGSVKYTNNSGKKNKVTGLALEKDLSKRTFVYLRNENATFDHTGIGGFYSNGAALTTGEPTRKVTAVGISHSF